MNRRTVTMDFSSLGVEHDEDDSFFDSCERLSSVVPVDLASGSDDDDEFFEASRMSFVSASIKRIYSIEPITNTSSILPSYDMWIAEPGDVKERRKRLLQGMGLSSNKDLLRLATSKVVRAISIKPVQDTVRLPISTPESLDSSPTPGSKADDEPSPPLRAIVLVRSRSDGDMEVFSTKKKQRQEEIIGPVSKNRLTRTSSGQLVPSTGACQYSCAVNVRVFAESEKSRPSMPNNGVSQCVLTDDAFGSFFLIKNLDTGKDFIVKEFNEQGMWNKLNDVETGKQLTMEEFEKSVGYSPVVKELMRRVSRNIRNEGGKVGQNSHFTKSFRNSTRKGNALLKNIKGVANSVKLLGDKEEENSSQVDQKVSKPTSQWIDAHQHGKSYKEFTALHLSQEIQAHEGSVWTIKFSSDSRLLASAGEDTIIHVWEVQECEVMPPKSADDLSSASAHPMDANASNRLPRVEISSMPSEMRKKGRKSGKGNSIPDYVKVPETVLTLSEKPICTFKGHKDEVLDLSWSKSQLLLSSSMDKTVRMWDMETKSCLKIFAHKDYVTCVQFNPVAENYFISGSLDGKVRIWSIPDRQVVDWTDVHEMVTAASYTPDGQGAIVGSQQGSCRMYSTDDSRLEHRMDIQKKKKSQSKKFPAFQSQAKKIPGFQSQTPPGKITGFQFAPWNPSEVLVTSADSRIGIYNGSDLIQKFRGFRNTSSQISASFSPDGKHIISSSEDSQVYIWKVEESKNPGSGKRKSTVTVHAHEQFHCKDVSVAITWPGSRKIEAPVVDLHSKKNSKRPSAPPITTSPTREDSDNAASAGNSSGLPPRPKKKNESEETTRCIDEDSAQSAPVDPGMGIAESSSASVSDGESPSVSASAATPSQTQLSDNESSNNVGGHTIQATAWGLVIVTASLEGEIRVYQNFGLPLKVTRQAYLF